jgi:hypothetical protein
MYIGTGPNRKEKPSGLQVRPLQQAGYPVETPEMPWSKTRYIDKTFEDSPKEIDQAVLCLTA